jgi:hypothetical protein
MAFLTAADFPNAPVSIFLLDKNHVGIEDVDVGRHVIIRGDSSGNV